jgi:hypothetical protein
VRLPLTREVIELVAVSHGVCIHPVPLRRNDPETGQSAIVDVPCGATSTSKCPPCAERARLLRMQQCRQGWHLDEEPVVEDVDPTDEQTDLATMRADLQAALVKAGEAGLPTEPMSETIEHIEGQTGGIRASRPGAALGAASSSSVHQAPPRRPGPTAPAGGCHDGGPHVHRTGGKMFRPSIFLTLTCRSYGRVNSLGVPRDLDAYDYKTAARDAIHFPKLVDRFWQNLRRVVGDATSWDQLVRDLGHPGLVRHGLRHTALTWMADAGVELHILQRVAGHQDPAVTSRYLHPDTQAVLDACTAFSAWLSGIGPEKPALGIVQGGRSGA